MNSGQLALKQEIFGVNQEIISAGGAAGPQEMGKVMGPARQKLKGRAEGKIVQDLVKAKLAGI
ncbi:GatB/YqeY domain-containing protein [Lyngbya confervoides]|uniref:GatB/YqeY domain-containing protein n=1 Tax=Lyngbya confervoides BDU141951 TaxID=1574623 RepID=A0ABD4T456_9CYAN|nr:GatB/YqeY domain-containing protein [Lyngbya confervoides]MCM1983233.1 GatB/YqeY domain-containing protein [Lyngbya confervoides BDU141951]